MKLKIAALKKLSESLAVATVAAGEVDAQGETVTISAERFEEVKAAQPSTLTPQSQWPVWARLVRSRRLPGDRGVGDTVEHDIGLMGSVDFAFWFYCVFGAGAPCPACPGRWNALYPYPQSQSLDLKGAVHLAI